MTRKLSSLEQYYQYKFGNAASILSQYCNPRPVFCPQPLSWGCYKFEASCPHPRGKHTGMEFVMKEASSTNKRHTTIIITPQTPAWKASYGTSKPLYGEPRPVRECYTVAQYEVFCHCHTCGLQVIRQQPLSCTISMIISHLQFSYMTAFKNSFRNLVISCYILALQPEFISTRKIRLGRHNRHTPFFYCNALPTAILGHQP